MTETALIRVDRIHKSFPGVHALDDVSLDIQQGEIHAIVGENGAGKSTLIKILSGIYRPDAGAVLVDGSPVTIASPHAATKLGISAVQQESQLVPYLSIAENVMLGRQPRRRFFRIDRAQRDRRAREILDRLGVDLDVRAPVEGLSSAHAQMVTIARAISVEARVVILDEPTASLSQREVESLFDVVRQLRRDHISVIYISHRLEEVFELADRVSVLRDGRLIATSNVDGTTIDDVVVMMIGRAPKDLFVRARRSAPGAPVLEVRDARVGNVVRGVSLQVRAGELVGLYGIVGSGRTELVRAIFGADRLSAGEIKLDGRPVQRSTPRRSVRAGLGLAPENRKRDGLVLDLSVRDNIALARIGMPDPFLYRPKAVRRLAYQFVQTLGIRVANVDRPAAELSGGNQQRVVIAKWLTLRPRVLILDEPTQGIDIGAKAEIYRIISDLLNDGVAVLMVSSDLPEVVRMADRVLVMRRGQLVDEFAQDFATEDAVGRSALGASGSPVGGELMDAS
jgi:ribose transport system ATP-binding protein